MRYAPDGVSGCSVVLIALALGVGGLGYMRLRGKGVTPDNPG
jgi:hypothetical protein